ncbi:MAG: AAA family ATPase [Clostridia bacterium]|nr:AAA family ATPase [Clostridia bacterium]
MKIAVTGKGGVGKTTFAAVLARLYASEGRTVLTADVDPDSNLGLALGFTPEELSEIVPISKMRELIAQRTGSSGDGLGKFFKINPKVDDIPEKFAKEKNGVRMLVMGTVETGGSGCVCPEHVVLRRLISHLILQRDEVVIMDMEAGLEHLGRGTADSMDQFIVVVEPGARSVQTYHQIKKLAGDLGIRRVSVVANKIRDARDEDFIRGQIPQQDLLGMIHYSPEVAAADRDAVSPYDAAPSATDEIRQIKQIIDKEEV